MRTIYVSGLFVLLCSGVVYAEQSGQLLPFFYSADQYRQLRSKQEYLLRQANNRFNAAERDYVLSFKAVPKTVPQQIVHELYRLSSELCNAQKQRLIAQITLEYLVKTSQLLSEITKLQSTVKQLQLGGSSSYAADSDEFTDIEGYTGSEEPVHGTTMEGSEDLESIEQEVSTDEGEEEDQESSDTDEDQEKESLKNMPLDQLAQKRVQIEALKELFKQNEEKEREGTAEPGWRALLYKQFKQIKDWVFEE